MAECPIDSGKLLIGYETGYSVLWNLITKQADYRYRIEVDKHLRSIYVGSFSENYGPNELPTYVLLTLFKDRLRELRI